MDIDRDVDFDKGIITVRGAVSFAEGNQPQLTAGKTDAAQRTIPLVPRWQKRFGGVMACSARRRTAP